ncbi:MAG: hypothetical protein AAF242_00200 [Bacteroidota bacterium]
MNQASNNTPQWHAKQVAVKVDHMRLHAYDRLMKIIENADCENLKKLWDFQELMQKDGVNLWDVRCAVTMRLLSGMNNKPCKFRFKGLEEYETVEMLLQIYFEMNRILVNAKNYKKYNGKISSVKRYFRRLNLSAGITTQSAF